MIPNWNGGGGGAVDLWLKMVCLTTSTLVPRNLGLKIIPGENRNSASYEMLRLSQFERRWRKKGAGKGASAGFWFHV